MTKLPPILADRSIVYQGKDEFTEIDIRENADFRSMQFNGIYIQSEMSLKNPYALTLDYIRTMALGLVFQPHVKSVLTLGVGAGSLPKFIWKYFPQCNQDLVERSSLVIELAHTYFGLPKDHRMQIHIKDDYAYITHTETQYDIIFLDIYQEASLSELQNKPHYFDICKKLLKKDGVLVWNTFAHDLKLINSIFVPQLCTTFGRNILTLSATNQKSSILFAFNSDMKHYPLAKVIEKAQELEKITQTNFPQMLTDHHNLKYCGFVFQT